MTLTSEQLARQTMHYGLLMDQFDAFVNFLRSEVVEYESSTEWNPLGNNYPFLMTTTRVFKKAKRFLEDRDLAYNLTGLGVCRKLKL